MRKNDDRDGTDEVGGWALLLSSLTVNHFLMVFVPELHLKIQN